MQKILVVDDEKSMRELLTLMLKREGYRVVSAESAERAGDLIEREAYDLVISDISMPGASGIDLLRRVRESGLDTPVILITAFGSKETAIEALQLGAFDYFEKPFNIEDVKNRVRNALDRARLVEENAFLRRELKGKYRLDGHSPRMREVLDLIPRIAATGSTVLITGESGTGKEQVARAIHYNSPRREGQFVSINCGALPDELLESELFGHMKGSFTGATANKKGLFEAADGGTIFLDEVGETSPAMQVKLLRVLQERKIRRVGATSEIEVDARVLTATNQDLDAMVAGKRFREDLFYRINVIPIHLPPLRERREDIEILALHFLETYCRIIGKRIETLSPDTLESLRSYHWPGNIRELENVIERAVALEQTGRVEPESLPLEVRSEVRRGPAAEVSAIPEEGFDVEERLESLRKAYMVEAMEKSGGVQSHAARVLGMTFRSFRYFAKKYGLGGRGGDASPEGAEGDFVEIESEAVPLEREVETGEF